jgi:hypothetical protein
MSTPESSVLAPKPPKPPSAAVPTWRGLLAVKEKWDAEAAAATAAEGLMRRAKSSRAPLKVDLIMCFFTWVARTYDGGKGGG